ncbi:MAG: hypothetical protein K5855_09375, partial [Oscillospiraceae bacterium]|nr:hypothetical protein [Oscillospiraceae bacterium]
MKKKLAALLLCAALVLTFLPAAAAAASSGLEAWKADDSSTFVHPGETAVMIVDAYTNAPGELTYAWYFYNEETWDYEPVEGETGSTLEAVNVRKMLSYRCDVSDSSGATCQVYFGVNLNNKLNAYAENDNDYILVYPGEDALLSVVVEGLDLEGVTYSWRDDNYNTIDGASSACYTVENVTSPAEYCCTVNDAYGTSCYVYFYVGVENEFSAEAEEEAVSVEPGENAVLKVNVTANNMTGVSYTWYDADYNVIEGAVGADYTVENVTGYSNYHCSVDDGYGNSQTVYFFISVNNDFYA